MVPWDENGQGQFSKGSERRSMTLMGPIWRKSRASSNIPVCWSSLVLTVTSRDWKLYPGMKRQRANMLLWQFIPSNTIQHGDSYSQSRVHPGYKSTAGVQPCQCQDFLSSDPGILLVCDPSIPHIRASSTPCVSTRPKWPI